MNYKATSPVLFLVFNRLDTTKIVFEAIRAFRPLRLYIACDGPRRYVEGEIDKVNIVRNYILGNIDWDCEVKTLFRPDNLGCKYSVSTAITWFFDNEEQGIILEDDCVPSESFFRYCQDLLERFKHDERVSLISGDGRGPESVGIIEDYAFCKYPLIWGWASWSRVWKNYDVEMIDWPEIRDSLSKSISTNRSTVQFWETTFDRVYNNQIDTWDYQFSFLIFKNNSKCIVPRVNLISNIGFGPDATHTLRGDKEIVNRTRGVLNFPLQHNVTRYSEDLINRFYDLNVFLNRPFLYRLLRFLVRKLMSVLSLKKFINLYG